MRHSVLYDLYVECTKVEHAIELLRAEKAKGWQIILPDDENDASYEG